MPTKDISGQTLTYDFGKDDPVKSRSKKRQLLTKMRNDKVRIGFFRKPDLKQGVESVEGTVFAMQPDSKSAPTLVIKWATLQNARVTVPAEQADEYRVNLDNIKVIEYRDSSLCIMGCGNQHRTDTLSCGKCV